MADNTGIENINDYDLEDEELDRTGGVKACPVGSAVCACRVGKS